MNKHYILPAIVILMLFAMSFVLVSENTITGAGGYSWDDDDDDNHRRRATPAGNFLAAKVFPVDQKVCTKQPKGSYERYAVFEGSLEFDPDNIPFFPCSKNKDCSHLGKDARCNNVKHIVIPEMGVIVQNPVEEPPPGFCGDGAVGPGEQCEPPFTSGNPFCTTILGTPFNTCNSQCQCEVDEGFCGDGRTNALEECDPPGPSSVECGGLACNSDCTCQTQCIPDCTGKECGDDGCGGSCGTCEFGCSPSGICEDDFCGNNILGPEEDCDPPGEFDADCEGICGADCTC